MDEANRKIQDKKKTIKHAIELLKDGSSNHLSILEYLYKLLEIYTSVKRIDLNKVLVLEEYRIHEYVKKSVVDLLLEMDFLSVAIKIFENEKEGDEQIINLVVIIIKKIKDNSFKRKETDAYKPKDAINPLYSILLDDYEKKIKSNALMAIIVIAKKYPLDVISCDRIKNSYNDILPSNTSYSNEQKKYVYFLFQEMIKEGIIKKGGYGSEIIEEMLFINEELKRKKDITNLDEKYLKIVNDFTVFAKEKEFEEKLWKNKNDILSDFIYYEWNALCKDNNGSDKIEIIIKKEEKEKIRTFCDYVLTCSFDIQIKFINKFNNILMFKDLYPDNFNYFKSRKNGYFLYTFFPLFFETYHFEERFPKLLYHIQESHTVLDPCYEYIILLYDETMAKIKNRIKEEMKMDERTMVVLMFLWSVKKKEDKKDEEMESLISITNKVFEWLGKIDERKDEKIDQKEKESVQKSNDGEIMKEVMNRKEICLYELLDIIIMNFMMYNNNVKERLKTDGKIVKQLLEIVENHLKNERCLIQKGSKKRIIEYVIYSYNKDIDTSNLISLPSPSFPFSNNTIIHILYNINKNLIFVDDKESINKNISTYLLEVLNNYMNLIRIIDECDVKKEIEKEISIEWNDHYINSLYDKIYLDWYNIKDIFVSYLYSTNSLSGDLNNNIIKSLIKFCIIHCNNYIHNNNEEKEKEKDNDNFLKEIMLIKPFVIVKDDRRIFTDEFLDSLIGHHYFTLFNIHYLINKSEEEFNIISIYMKELSGEIVDRIKNREGNDMKKERRRYERERIDIIYKSILASLGQMSEYVFYNRNKLCVGYNKNENNYIGKEKEMNEDKDYISDVIEEEDMRECLILYLKLIRKDFNNNLRLQTYYRYSKFAFYCFLSIILKK